MSGLRLGHIFISGGVDALVHRSYNGTSVQMGYLACYPCMGRNRTTVGVNKCRLQTVFELTYSDTTEQIFCYTKTFTEVIISLCLRPQLVCRRACDIRDASGKVFFFSLP